MIIERGKLYAVITGDIIGSSRLAENARLELHRAMVAGADALHKAFDNAVPMDVDIFRGDSWQLLVTIPSQALRVGLFYRAYLRARMAADTRLAIAVGTVDFIPGERVSGGDGQAYRSSGVGLEKLLKLSRFRMIFAENTNLKDSQALNVVVQLVDALAMNWTAKQAQAMLGILQGWTQETIAGAWWGKPISQQAVAQHLDRAGWHAIEQALVFFEDRLPNVV
ncbi:MAG: hypothetical protein JSW39_10635 [Desulfobacterales bacterium]|nr:MAG: hypothetical protein JSW39_10635 [Desulfobacterales bacterium]